MTEHCFISYSNADGPDFAQQLVNKLEGGSEHIETWFDKDDLNPAEAWDEQIADAIKSCKCLLFVMTKDSTTPNSVCKQEWTWALRYKKPVVPIRLHTDAELPFLLSSRQWIDFSSNFDAGLAKLRSYLQQLDSPKGALIELKLRLQDAERDFQRAKTEEEKLHAQNDINDLKESIKHQGVIVTDPKYAEKRTIRSITAGLQEERKPTQPPPETLNIRFVNPIPLIAPDYFQGRLSELSQIADFLKNNHQRILTIVGRGGGGKTALSCYLLKSLEFGELPENLGEFKVGGIVYLSEIGSHKVSFANIYSGLLQLLPNEISNRLDALYRQPKVSVGEKMRQLLESFQQETVIVLLDNFELFVDTETENLMDSELKEALENLLQAPHNSIKVIITTRVPARDLALVEPSRHNNLHLEEGLKSPYAENILRAMDEDGRAGFKVASDEQLGRARELTLGYPRALESLYAIISVDRYTSIEELLAVELPETVVENLVGEAFSRLDITAQKVMQALAVYNRPAPPIAIDYLLQHHVPGINSSLILTRLVSMHFARREAGRFYLHPVDREYAFKRIPEGERSKRIGKGARSRTWDQYSLLLRAADYFVEARKPKNECKTLDDLYAQLAEFDLLCVAQNFNDAQILLSEIDHDYLYLWGQHHLLIDLHERIREKTADRKLRMLNLNGLGIAYKDIGKVSNGKKILEQGLILACETNDRDDRSWKAVFLHNIGGCYTVLGKIKEGVDLFEKALLIDRVIKRQDGVGSSLVSLGLAYADLGEAEKSIGYYKEALVILRETKSQKSESVCLEDYGDALLDLGHIEDAILMYKQAIQIASEINFLETQSYSRWGLAQAYLMLKDLLGSYNTLVEASLYDVVLVNYNISTLMGIVKLQLGDVSMAGIAFKRAVEQADIILSNTSEHYDALESKGLAFCGLVLADNKAFISDAKEIFQQSRKIINAAGVINRTLRLFDELIKVDREGTLAEIRPLIAGKE